MSATRVGVGRIRATVLRLLLKDHELRNHEWRPTMTVADFIQRRLLPAVFCLKRTIYGDEASDQEALEVPAGERAEIRRLISIYLATILSQHSLAHCRSSIVSAVRADPGGNVAYNNIILPPQATHAFELAYQFSYFHTPDNIDEDLVLELICSIICGFLVISRATALATHEPTNYAEYDALGNLVDPSGDSTFLQLHVAALHGFSSEHLELMVEQFLQIREEFSWDPASKSAEQREMMRQYVRTYFQHAVHLQFVLSTGADRYFHPFQEHVADLVVRYKDLAAARRIPAPSVSWLNVVMRVENVYGFVGDEDAVFKAIMRGKVAYLYRYSLDLRQHAVDRHFIGDVPSKIAEFPSGICIPAMDAALSANGFTGNRTVYSYVALAEIVLRHLDFFAATRRNAVEYAQLEDGLLEYVMKIVRPFAHILSLCIPEGSMSLAELPIGRTEELHRFIVEFIIQCVRALFFSAMDQIFIASVLQSLVYDIAELRARLAGTSHFHVDSRATCCLNFAMKFDALLGKPSEGYAPQSRVFYIPRVRAAQKIVNERPSSEYNLDVPLPLAIMGLPCTAPWTSEEIDLLLWVEAHPFFHMEAEVLKWEVEISERLMEKLERSELYAKRRFSLGTTGRTSVM
ncbi:hypothetical protein DFH09DRAFT_1094891 [Mycena vulgaris]|nr:hypothetical protein DFH09DRAFT_1094891 [Mycena vulgaris]